MKQLKLKKFRSLKKPRSSSFGKKLESRRLFALLYGNISYNYSSRLFTKARTYTGKIGVKFLSLVERRLDVVVLKMFFFPSLYSARQCISHKGILVNNRIVNISSAFVKPGDIIQIRDHAQILSQVYPSLSSKSFVKHPHLEVNYKTLTGIFLFSPHQIYYTLPKLRCTEAGISFDEMRSNQ